MSTPRGAFYRFLGQWSTQAQVRPSLMLLGLIKKSFVHFEVRDGSRVLFWHDAWRGDRPSNSLFPDLVRMARLKYATVQ